ncbi:leucyl aminopeptidase family protein [Candidatus Stoquefichus massiliensis]|uniref:leucyl aminopeptidase family protein n=1 Tax=Candidatus Stoquefichus massiliensis TaxID=1470350 RepID=UPI000485400C|nr:leucyl aminopeptidase [Candidatus Stoquefichus massiliensis]
MKQINKNDIKNIQKNLIYPIYEDQEICKEIINKLGYDINQIVNKAFNEITKVYTLGQLPFKEIYFIGLGNSHTITTYQLRQAFCTISENLKEDICFNAIEAANENIDIHQITKLFVESYLLSQYKEQKIGHLEQEKFEVNIITDADVQKDIDEAIIYGEGINYARKLADTPANYMTPCHLVDEAKTLAKELGIECTILDKDALEDMKAGGILSVNQGSHIPAYMICLKYSQGGDMPYNAVVGKGITFDSGGYNLKGNSYGMKYDMCGAADVLGIMSILAKTKAKVNVYGIIPTTENLVSDKAYKPQDVITTLSGKTVEIVSTDAEGRLILCDALTYAQQLGAKSIIDLATLTGACVSALGDLYTGVFSNSERFYHKFDKVLKISDEKGWRLPIDEEYFKKLKSTSADFKNSVGKPGAGASIAANFLEAFIEDNVEWIHLDIAGTADNNGTGATGAMIRTVVNTIKEG